MRNRVRVLAVMLAALFLLGSALVAFAYSVPDDTVVYVTDKGTKYHRYGCSYLKSSRPLTIAQAEASGYEPCSRCHPDTLTGTYGSDWDGSGESGSGHGDSGSGHGGSGTTSTGRPKDPVIPKKEKADGWSRLLLLASLGFLVYCLISPLIVIPLEILQSRRHARVQEPTLTGGRQQGPVLDLVPCAPENETFRQAKAKYTALYGGRDPEELVHIPSGVEIGADGLPKVKGAKGWGRTFTVYVSKAGRCYHQKRGCCGATKPVHVCEAGYRWSACSKCCKVLPDLVWFNKYQRIKGIKKLYRIE